jgi:hypothetical protein
VQSAAHPNATKKQIMGQVASTLPTTPSFRTIERALQS